MKPRSSAWHVLLWTIAVSLPPPAAALVGSYTNPVDARPINDPFVLRAGGYFYRVATSADQPAGGRWNVPLARSTDLTTWQALGDILPTASLPSWVDHTSPVTLQGPSLLRRQAYVNGFFDYWVLYFSARDAVSGRKCIGTAVSTNVESGWVAQSTPLICASGHGDAIDPSPFVNVGASGVNPPAWIFWTWDVGLVNTPTTIYQQRLTDDGVALQAIPYPTLTAQGTGTWENGVVRAPAMMQDPTTGQYALLYSGTTPTNWQFGTNWASCSNVNGFFVNCTRQGATAAVGGGRGPWVFPNGHASSGGSAEVFYDDTGAPWLAYQGSGADDVTNFRVDKVCFRTSPLFRPRTTAPSWTTQTLARTADCETDVVPFIEAWPEAEALFRQNPSWLGADGAFSLKLGTNRVLWMFGDTFIDPSAPYDRAGAPMVRNTIAIQSGSTDPSSSTAVFSPAWRTGAGGAPASYFPPPAGAPDDWVWPAGAAKVGTKLVVFLAQEHNVSPTQYAPVGYRAVVIPAITGSPSTWDLSVDVPVPLPGFAGGPTGFTPPADQILLQYELVEGSYVYAWGTGTTPSGQITMPVYLWRYTTAAASAGDFSQPAFYVAGKWKTPAQMTTNPTAVATLVAGPHVAIQKDPVSATYFMLADSVFVWMYFSTSVAKQGPWSAQDDLAFAPETYLANAFAYAPSFHPELTGARMAVTYSSNADLPTVVGDDTLYFPRFLKMVPP